jgi:hypothetical protein
MVVASDLAGEGANSRWGLESVSLSEESEVGGETGGVDGGVDGAVDGGLEGGVLGGVGVCAGAGGTAAAEGPAARAASLAENLTAPGTAGAGSRLGVRGMRCCNSNEH